MQSVVPTPTDQFTSPREAKQAFLELLRDIYRELGQEGKLSDGSILPQAIWNILPRYEPVFLRLELKELSGTVSFRLTCGYGPVGTEFGDWSYYVEGAISRRRDPRTSILAANYSVLPNLSRLKEEVLDRLRGYIETHQPDGDGDD